MTQGEAEARKRANRRSPSRTLRGEKRVCVLRACALTCAALWTATTLGGFAPKPAPSEPLEYEVKAAFLFRFAQFVEWPADTFKEANDPFTYCTIGARAATTW